MNTASIRRPHPVFDLFGRKPSAVWPGDKITVIERAGSHRTCIVASGYEYPRAFTTRVHKRLLRFHRP